MTPRQRRDALRDDWLRAAETALAAARKARSVATLAVALNSAADAIVTAQVMIGMTALRDEPFTWPEGEISA